ncbi:PRC-barrel domain containing protein [Wenzhouxiangella sp. XN201]|nr:PRC-barrel domain containing protein [Wenzhouxiangella sp. XN201]
MQAGATLTSAATITGEQVRNLQGESLGKIQDLMFDITEGKIRYAILESADFLAMSSRLFAVPWKALKRDGESRGFRLDMDTEYLRKAPGFGKDDWPNMADAAWRARIDSFYAR